MFGLFKRKRPRVEPKSVALEPPDDDQLPDPPEGYDVFTRQFDREVAAADFIVELGWTAKDAAREFQRRQTELCEETQGEAELGERALEFQKRWRAGHDLGEQPIVTVLLDHSGSMRGLKARAAAKSAIAIGQAIEGLGATIEVLGFTTSTWLGGRSRKLWESRRDSPTFPGRLCDLLHIVYRTGDGPPTDWAKNLALMLDDSALKENIDGEALLWARQRARRLDPTGWVCLIVSDGSPVDDSTIMANGFGRSSWYLQRHLDSVVEAVKSDAEFLHGTRIGCLAFDDVDMEGVYTWPVKDPGDAPVAAFNLLEWMLWPEPATAEGRS